MGVAQVEPVGQGVAHDRVTCAVDAYTTVAAVAQYGDERCGVAEVRHQPLVGVGVGVWERGGGEGGGVLGGLDQKPVALLGILELVDEPGLGSALPGLKVVVVDAHGRRGWVQV